MQRNEDGSLDEVVITDPIESFWIEQMDDGKWSFAVEMKDGTRHFFSLATRRNAKIEAYYDHEE